MVAYWWRELNHALFNGELRTPKAFVIREFFKDDCWAWCIAEQEHSKHSDIMIGLSQEIDDRKFFLAILAHEMVHQWEQQKFGRMTHGKHFLEWEHKVRQLGLEFAKSY